jgi:hypothetical protein
VDKIYHYTSFDTFQKIVENGVIRFNSLMNVDDAEEGFLLDTQSQAPYTFVSCWTSQKREIIPLWKMYVNSPFAVRIEFSPDFLKPQFFKKHFIANHTNRNAYVFLFHRGERGTEFLSKVVYKEQPRIQMYKDVRGLMTQGYIEDYALTKNERWEFQEEVRFVLQAVPIKQLRPRRGSSLYNTCQEVIINNDPTDIQFIDMAYDKICLMSAGIMLGPSTTTEHENELREYLSTHLPEYHGEISRSGAFIRERG